MVLLSADESSLLVVSYDNLKRCFLRCQQEMREHADKVAKA